MFSVILNIITLLVVSVLIYAFYKMYKYREDRSLNASQVFQNFLKEPSSYSHRVYTEDVGPIGDFVGYTWEDNKILETYEV